MSEVFNENSAQAPHEKAENPHVFQKAYGGDGSGGRNGEMTN